jgi:predicted metal-dependent enzyme (double-stranded beta helix superfamily)
MCDFHNDQPLPPNGEDQFVLDTPVMRRFIAAVNAARASAPNDEAAIELIRPHFAQLLADPDWLPTEYQETRAESASGSGAGMGANTGLWLLYRAGDGSLAFSVLVLGAGRETPVHDHLGWGLVGLYRGLQDEVVYRRQDDGTRDAYADLAISERNALTPGDFYTLLPQNDIHSVRTTSEMTSVSLHLLGSDTGCIARRQYVLEEKLARPYRSGYLNVECADGEGRGTPTWDEVHESVRRMPAIRSDAPGSG